MREDVKVFLKHIQESISLIETYTADISREDFLSSAQLQDSVIRMPEIIGEATKHLPAKFRDQHLTTPQRPRTYEVRTTQ